MRRTMCLSVLTIVVLSGLCNGLPKYFQSSEWQGKAPSFSEAANVPKNMTDKLSSVTIKGPPCKQLFAARVFCLQKCNEECQGHGDMSTLKKLKCTIFKGKRKSADPKEIDMGCKCFYPKKKGQKKRCDTERYSWYQIEQFFSKTYGGQATSAPVTSAAGTTAASASSGVTTAAAGATTAAAGVTTAAAGATTAAAGATTAAGGATTAPGAATTAGGAVTTAGGATTGAVAATTAAAGG